ncbi:uncharacterized protein LOC123308235 [Coccinella septempunctata]|uniref:uncharacterized protein LOC123308235 n=1 Tax=Coccinella septempunctata TaxID=41139 RepID=UPI001D069BC6|nr:uncharacterized protein LOC123308235 [Coccinella septempunctata]
MRAVFGFFILVIVTVVVPSQSFVEILDYLRNDKCSIPELQFSEDEMSKVTNLEIFKRRIRCALVQQGFLTMDGDFRTDMIRQNLYLGEPEVREELIKECVHKMNTPDDTAYEALVCFFRQEISRREMNQNDSQSTTSLP